MGRLATWCAALLGATAWSALPAAAMPPEDSAPTLHLVTLEGPGAAGYDGLRTPSAHRAVLRLEQDRLLATLDDAEPVYRWTSALNGFAVRLTAREADALARLPGVARVEPESVRPLAAARVAAPQVGATRSGEGGRGTVIGIVDTGLDPDSPVFAETPRLGPDREDFRGTCPAADGWSPQDCSGKVVAARHFVAGFGVEDLRSGARVSPLDDVGHGTQVASLAAGNADVTAVDGSTHLGRFSGAAPDARIAVYRACWAAPDPRDDGCSTADVVTAIDRAVADGVDVLNLSVTGDPGVDTVDLALLGAAEQDVVVTAAAGNAVPHAGYDVPWVLTVGSSDGPERPGRVVLPDGSTVTGVLTAPGELGPARLVAGADVPAPGADPDDARRCLPGSLDAGRTAGRVVLCERGGGARVDKSDAVELADGAGMVLVNARPGQPVNADFHAVPTVHVDRAGGDVLRAAIADGPVAVRLEPAAPTGARPGASGWSAVGAGTGAVVKPDVLTAGDGLLAAATGGQRWQLVTGTSAASARMSGYAARVRAAHPRWSAARVRSALTGSAVSAQGEPSSLRQGAGLARADEALSPGLVMDIPAGGYRDALADGDLRRLNTASVLLRPLRRPVTVTREVTNVTGDHAYFSSSRWGFRRHDVLVTPAALRIPPGETRTVRIDVAPRSGVPEGRDSGWVAWRGADGSRLRLPVVVAGH